MGTRIPDVNPCPAHRTLSPARHDEFAAGAGSREMRRVKPRKPEETTPTSSLGWLRAGESGILLMIDKHRHYGRADENPMNIVATQGQANCLTPNGLAIFVNCGG